MLQLREVEGQALPCSVLAFMLSILGWGEEEEEENEVERRGSWKTVTPAELVLAN